MAVQTNFGIGEEYPTALTTHNNTMYMVAQGAPSGQSGNSRARTAGLYSVDPTTGRATRIDDFQRVSDFDVGEERPVGLVSHGLATRIRLSAAVSGLATTDLSLSGLPSGSPAVTLSGVLAVGTEPTTLWDLTFSRPLTSTEIANLTATRSSTSTTLTTGTTITVYNPAKLYMVGATKRRLYELDTTTGRATAIRPEPVSQFGISETEPEGMVFHGSPAKLYFVGNDTNYLSEMDPSTGEATRVGTATNYGLTAAPNFGDLASDGTNLYAVSVVSSIEGLYTIDVTDGTASKVSFDNRGFGVSEIAATSVASDGTNFWMVGYGNAHNTTARLYKLSKDTGKATIVNNSLSNFGVTGQFFPTGLTYFGAAGSGNLYMEGYTVATTSSSFYEIRLPTGEGSQSSFTNNEVIGGLKNLGSISVSNTVDMAVDPATSTIYLANRDGNIYTVDRTNGNTTAVANTGHGLTSNVSGIANHAAANTLYIKETTSHRDGTLYTVVVNQNPVARIQLGAALSGLATTDLTVTNIPRSKTFDSVTAVGGSNTALWDLNFSGDNLTAAEISSLTVIRNSSSSKTFTISEKYNGQRATRIGAEGAINQSISVGMVNSNRDNAPSATNPLYTLTTGSGGGLFTINATTGVTTRVTGAITNFGLSTPETDPTCLEWGGSGANESLYMTGTATKKMYRMDKDTGQATDLGTLSGIASGQDPQGLSWRGNEFYLCASGSSNGVFIYSQLLPQTNNFRSYQVVGNLNNFGLPSAGEKNSRALAILNDEVYMIGADTNEFYKLHLGSGANEGRAYPLTLAAGFGAGITTPKALGSFATALGLFTDTGFMYFNLTSTDLDTTTGYGTATTITPYANAATLDPRGVVFQNPNVYITNDQDNTLSTYNRSSGAQTQVGSATSFGPNALETSPRGLTIFNNQMYMVGQTNSVLYEVDSSTGVATKVGDTSGQGQQPQPQPQPQTPRITTNFNVGEQYPTGLAVFDNTLYMVAQGAPSGQVGAARGTKYAALYSIDTTTGFATRIDNLGTVRDFGVGEERPVGLVAFGNPANLYMVGETKRRLYILNTTTGEATTVRPEDISQFGISESEPQGLANHNGTLYFVGNDSDYLCTLNQTTGEATRVGTATNFGLTAAPHFGDLTSDGTNLYAVTGVSSIAGLYTIDTTDGTASKVAITSFGVSETTPTSVASDGTNLWMVGGNEKLYKVNKSTGEATEVGSSVTQFGLSASPGTAAIAYVGTAGSGKLYLGAGQKLYDIKLPSTEGSQTGFTTESDGEAREVRSNLSISGGLIDLASKGGRLYASNGSIIYEIGLGAGFSSSSAATQINNRAHGITNISGLANHATGFNLYVLSNSNTGTLYTVDTDSNSNTIRITLSSAVGSLLRGNVLVAGYTVRSLTRVSNSVYDVELNNNITAAQTAGLVITFSGITGITVTDRYNLSRATRLGASDGLVGIANAKGIVNSNHDSAPSSTNPLYMVSDTDNGSLYSLSTTDGAATKITGSITNFGLSTAETDPIGLVWGGTGGNEALYMTGTVTDKLYSISKGSGRATDLGSLSGVTGGQDPQTLAWNGTNLYLLTSGTADASFIYILSYAGAATGLGSINNFGVTPDEKNPRGLDFVSGTAYMVGKDGAKLYQVILTSGNTFGQGYPLGIGPGFGDGITDPRALVADDTNLALLTDSSVTTINLDNTNLDPSTGYGTAGSAVSYTDTQLEPRGATYDDNLWYLTDDQSNALYNLDRSNGTTTQVGSAVNFGPRANEEEPRGIAILDNQMYMVGQTNPILYRLNSVTGIALKIDDEGEADRNTSIIPQLVDFYQSCAPLPSARDDFTNENSKKNLPVTLSGTPDSRGLPSVKMTEGNAAPGQQEVPYGTFCGVTGSGEDMVVTVAVKGRDMIFANVNKTAGPITAADLGKGVLGSNVNGQDQGVVAVSNGVNHLAKGFITGGNLVQGTNTAPAFFRVSFN